MADIYIKDLNPGDEVLCWMRLGLALTLGQRGDGSLYRYVPSKPQVAGPRDLTRFSGWVIKNQPDLGIITMQVSPNSSRASVIYGQEPALVADVSYSSLKRMRKYSTVHVPARTDNNTFPANFEDAAFKPFRTLTEVKLV